MIYNFQSINFELSSSVHRSSCFRSSRPGRFYKRIFYSLLSYLFEISTAANRSEIQLMLFYIFINVRRLEIESLHVTLLWSSSDYLEPIPKLSDQFHSYLNWKICHKVYYLVPFSTHQDVVNLITSLPIRRRPIYLWTFRVEKKVLLRIRYFYVTNFTTLKTPSLISSCILMCPIIICLKVSYFRNFELKYSNKIFICYVGSWSSACSDSSKTVPWVIKFIPSLDLRVQCSNSIQGTSVSVVPSVLNY